MPETVSVPSPITSGIKCPMILRDKIAKIYLYKSVNLGELARLANSNKLFIYSIAIKPNMGPAKKEITNINNKLN